MHHHAYSVKHNVIVYISMVLWEKNPVPRLLGALAQGSVGLIFKFYVVMYHLNLSSRVNGYCTLSKG